MNSRDADALNGIQLNIERARTLVDGATAASLREDWARFYAVTRCLEIISEAARRLSEDLRARHPEIEWKAIMGSGNVYRHAYSKVLEERVLATVQDGFAPLIKVVEQELGTF